MRVRGFCLSVFRGAWRRLLWGAIGTACLASAAASQDAGTGPLYRVELRLVSLSGISEVAIRGCEGPVGVSIDGVGLEFDCPAALVYQVLVDGEPRYFGYQRRRESAFSSPLSIENHLAGPLRVIEVVSTEAEAREIVSTLDGIELPDEIAALRATGSDEPTARTSDREPVTSFTVEIDSTLGTVTTDVGQLGEWQITDRRTLAAPWRVPTREMGREARFSLVDKASCMQVVRPTEHAVNSPIRLDDFGCLMIEIDVPRQVRVIGPPECRDGEPGKVICVLKDTAEGITLQLDSWEDAYVDLNAQRLDASALRAKLPLDPAHPALLGQPEMACGSPGWDVYFVGYCTGQSGCLGETKPLESASDGESFVLPTLGEAGIPSGVMPDSLRLSLRSRAASGEARELRLPLGVSRGELDAELSRLSEQPRYPLELRVESESLKAKEGRELQFFRDAQCKERIPDATKSLDNFATATPTVPACAYSQVFDGPVPRSACEPVSFDPETELVSASPVLADCGDNRVVLLIIENRSFSELGVRLQQALDALALGLFEAKDSLCMPIDVVRSRDLEQGELFKGEDLLLVSDFRLDFLATLPAFEFANTISEPLRDFNWIDSTWGDKLNGIIVIVDGSLRSKVDQSKVGVPLSWRIDGVYSKVFSMGPPGSCEVYTRDLKMESCEEVADGFDPKVFAEKLRRAAEEGVSRKRGQ